MLRLFFITNSAEIAAFAVQSGVDRIFVDLEFEGKRARQGHLSTVISRHSLSDVGAVRQAVPETDLMVRVNPLGSNTRAEVEGALEHGADILMLPMFQTSGEVKQFLEMVAGRCRVCLLVETVAATRNLKDIAAIDGIDEFHIGLNDLNIERGTHFMFAPFADGEADHWAATLRSTGIPFGIGGLARVGEGLLPAEMVIAEHCRLGSTAAILSRTFHREYQSVAEIETNMDFVGEISKLRAAYDKFRDSNADELRVVHRQVSQRIGEIMGTQEL